MKRGTVDRRRFGGMKPFAQHIMKRRFKRFNRACLSATVAVREFTKACEGFNEALP